MFQEPNWKKGEAHIIWCRYGFKPLVLEFQLIAEHNECFLRTEADILVELFIRFSSPQKGKIILQISRVVLLLRTPLYIHLWDALGR